MVKILLLLTLLLLIITPVRAQAESPRVEDVSYDAVVSDSISSTAVFDWWQFAAEAGDVVVAKMEASGGLAPFIGLRSPGGDVIFTSPEGDIDGMVELEYTIEIAGKYAIVPTRVGVLEGTTSGDYTLTLRRANSAAQNDANPLQEVEFRCVDFLVTTAATVQFFDDPAPEEFYRITIFGLDGFQPVIRAHLSGPDITDCNNDSQAMGGDSLTLPGEATVTLSATVGDEGAQLLLRRREDTPAFGLITLTIGSKDGAPGRYLAVIEGFMISEGRDTDTVIARLGPLARETDMLVYMVGTGRDRLDPYLIWSDDTIEFEVSCDDAGRRGCEDVPPITDVRVTIHEGEEVTISGDRFDAGLRLNPGHPDPLSLEMSSRDGNTDGAYALLIIGELPASDVEK